MTVTNFGNTYFVIVLPILVVVLSVISQCGTSLAIISTGSNWMDCVCKNGNMTSLHNAQNVMAVIKMQTTFSHSII